MQKHQVVGTCEWISQLHQYQCWLGGDGRLLWICGEPGKGKTVLSLSITEQLVKIAADSEGSTQVLYYFCNFDDERRNKAVAVLRGLIYQLDSIGSPQLQVNTTRLLRQGPKAR